MPSRNQRRRTLLALPWERHAGALSRLFAQRGRWRAVLGVGVLLGLLAVVAHHASERRARRQTRIAIDALERAAARFLAERGRFPESQVELAQPTRMGEVYLRSVPLDGWGQRLKLLCPSSTSKNHCKAISAGPSASFRHDDNLY